MDKIEIGKEFLKQVVEDIKKQTKIHYDATNRQTHIIATNEKKVYSILSPVFGKIGEWSIMECCVDRSPKETGFLDYLIKYRNHLFAVEIKLAHIGLQKKEISKSDKVYFKFSELLQQLNELDLHKFKFLKNNSKGLIKMALLIVVFAGESETNESRNEKIGELKSIERNIEGKYEEISKTIKEKLNVEVNYRHLWFLNNDLLCARGRKKTSKYGLYPGIAFIAHIYEE